MEEKIEGRIEAKKLLEEIKACLKDCFVATMRTKGDEVEIKFTNGQIFTLTVWENIPR